MKKTFETLVRLHNTRGRNDKRDIIKENEDDLQLLNILKYSMDDYMVYGVSENSFKTILEKDEFYYTPEQMETIHKSVTDWADESVINKFITVVIPKLIDSKTHSQVIIDYLDEFFNENNLNKIERYFYYRCIIKNLNLGIGPKTINKALDRILIKQYTPMLADSGLEKFDKWKKDENFIYCCDTKINGLRLTLFINKEDIVIKTRSGLRFYALEDYMKANWLTNEDNLKLLDTMLNQSYSLDVVPEEDFDTLVLDCELQHIDKTWESSISIINVKDVIIFDFVTNEPNFYLHLFDVTTEIPFKPENFDVDMTNRPYKQRRKVLKYFHANLPDVLCNKLFVVTNSVQSDNLKDVEKIVQVWIDEGFEGGIIKHPDSSYSCKRSNVWLKIKDIQTYDGQIVEVLNGEKSGKYANTAGKITVKANINGKELTGTCGSGFKDADREYLWENKNMVIGKTVEFTILGKTVKDNFQSGIFKGFRVDK